MKFYSQNLAMVSVVIIAVLLSGCGVSKKEYMKLQHDLAETEKVVSSLQDKIDHLKVSLERAGEEKAAMKASYDGVLGMTNSLENQISQLNTRIDIQNQVKKGLEARLQVEIGKNMSLSKQLGKKTAR